MKKPIRLAHASDIHLDSDYYGGEENIASRDTCRKIFSDLLTRIKEQSPDLFLLPGDLFDSNRASDDTITWSMEQLGQLPFPVAMIPGNHDCLAENAIFYKHDFSSIPNISILLNTQGETCTLPSLGLRIWGKGMVSHTPEFQPLGGIADPEKDLWNIAMGHGIYVGKGGQTFRSSPVKAEEIGASQYDYIALGHHHALLDVSTEDTCAFFSGSPSPISTQDQGTFLTVELQPNETTQATIHTM